MAPSKEYPKIVPCNRGFEVQVSKKVKLPGIYISGLMAERAANRYEAESKIARNRKKGS